MSWTKTCITPRLNVQNKCASYKVTPPISYTFLLREKCLFSPRMLLRLFNLLFPSSFLNLHSTRRDKVKTGMNIANAFMVTVRHLKNFLKPLLVSRGAENGFLPSMSGGLSFFFLFFTLFYSSFYQFESRGGAEEVCLKGNPLCFVAEVTDSGWLME